MEILSIILLVLIGILLPVIGKLLDKAITQNKKLKDYIQAKGLKDDFVMWQTKRDIGRELTKEEDEVLKSGIRNR